MKSRLNNLNQLELLTWQDFISLICFLPDVKEAIVSGFSVPHSNLKVLCNSNNQIVRRVIP